MVQAQIAILCLIGIPASGKTHLASLIAKHKLGFTEVLLLCYDDLIKWNPDTFVWKEKRKNIFTIVESKVLSFLSKKLMNEMLLIILDDNMYYRSMRYVFYKLAKKHRIKFCQVYVDTPLITCLIRNCYRNEQLPTYQILNINEKLEVPFNFSTWEKNTIKVNGEQNFENYLDIIKIFIESSDIPPELDIEKEPTKSQNSKHIADLALRRIISLLAKEMKAYGEYNIAEKISELNKKRFKIMNFIYNDQIHLPSHQEIDIFIQHLFPIMTAELKTFLQ